MRIALPRGITAAAVLYSSFLSAAQTPDQILRDQQQQLDLQRQELLKRPDIFAPLPKQTEQAPTSLPAQGPCFEIHHIALLNTPPAWQDWMTHATAAIRGQCMNVPKLQSLVQDLTNQLIARGFVTSRVYLPEQNLKTGTLRLAVVPGRLGSIHLKDGSSDLSLRAAFPLTSGEILNVRALEQGLEQLSRARSQQATMEIVPGAEDGMSDVIITRQRGKPWTAAFSWDDSGQPSTGVQQGNATLGIDNVIGINDALSLSWSQELGQLTDPRTRSDTLSWVLPWGNWTGMASYSESAYHQLIQGSNQLLVSSGHSRNTFLSLSRLIDRDQFSKTEIALQLTRKASRSFIADAEILNQRRDLTALGLELSHRRQWNSWQLDGALAYSRELGLWGAMPNTLAAQSGPSARAEIWTAHLNISSPFKLGQQNLRWSSEWRGQYSPNLLMGSEQFSIGSRYTVRGFNTTSLTGQSGWVLRNELGWALLPPTSHGRTLDIFAGLDVGQVARQTGSSWDTNTLSGWAAGLRATLCPGFTAELSHERALHQPTGWNRPAITHFRLAMQY
ncbi:ShlB/FhaC/HecB family hemolysin secretion/activation protein [Aquitalea sp.]|uniref:ShlB/FhaC/HecB family hemolysin secretion/activation protein n=1 Tax=Aquitalea sp. TaxID=1872623 RepID=UPI002589E37A|nr:ShlB/FhaC/HecB family hemolysin secretion/activation protein [Aquitalea sp.]